MARTALTPQSAKHNGTVITAGQLALTMTACDVANGNLFPHTGKEVLVVQNSDATPHNLTISSVADYLGRVGDITTYAIPATTICAIQLKFTDGWTQADGNLYLSGDNVNVKFAVLKLS